MFSFSRRLLQQKQHIASIVFRIRSVIPAKTKARGNNNNNNNNALVLSSSADNAAIRDALKALSERADEFIEWSQTCPMNSLAQILQAAQLCRVGANGHFVNRVAVPALHKRFCAQQAKTRKRSAAAAAAAALVERSHQRPYSALDAEQEAIVLRRMAELRIFDLAGGAQKLQLLQTLSQRVCESLIVIGGGGGSASPPSPTTADGSSVEEVIDDEIAALLENSRRSKIKRVNHVFCALAEAAVRSPPTHAGHTALLDSSVQLMRATTPLLLPAQLVTKIDTPDLFHLVRIFRQAVGILSFCSSPSSSSSSSSSSSAPNTAVSLTSNIQDSDTFCLACINILNANMARLRGSHVVTVLQGSSKAATAVTQSPLMFSAQLKNAVAVICHNAIVSFAKNDNNTSQNNNKTPPQHQQQGTQLTLSSRQFDTTPAALAKAVLSIEVASTFLRQHSGDAAVEGRCRAVLGRAMAVLAQDLEAAELKAQQAAVPAQLLSTVACCEMLSAIRLQIQQHQKQQQNTSSQFNSNDNHQAVAAILGVVARQFVTIFHSALRQDATSTQLVLLAAIDCRIALSADQLLDMCRLFDGRVKHHAKQAQHHQSPNQNQSQQQHEHFQQQQDRQHDATLLQHRVIARHLTRLGVRAATGGGGHKQKELREALVGNASSVFVPLKASAGSPAAAAADAATALQICVEALRNLLAIGATLEECSRIAETAIEMLDAPSCSSSSSSSFSELLVVQVLHLVRAVSSAAVARPEEVTNDAAILELLEHRANVLSLVVAEYQKLQRRLGSTSGNNNSSRQRHQAAVCCSAIAEGYVRCGLGADALLAAAIRSSAPSEAASSAASTEIGASSSASLVVHAGAEDDDHQDDTGRASKLFARSIEEEFVFACICAEHLLFGVEEQDIVLRRRGGGETKPVSLFEFLASSGGGGGAADDADAHLLLSATFERCLDKIVTEDLHRNVSAQLPFSLPSKVARCDPKEHPNTAARGPVTRRLLARLVPK